MTNQELAAAVLVTWGLLQKTGRQSKPYPLLVNHFDNLLLEQAARADVAAYLPPKTSKAPNSGC